MDNDFLFGEELTASNDPVISGVASILSKCFTLKGSDIHAEPLEDRLRIRYRIDGVLKEAFAFPKSHVNPIISSLKIMSKLDISEKRLREIYRNARLLILPFIHCTANNSLLEAIACGLPVVSNDVGSIRDYAKDEFADLLPPGDADGMTEAIFRLINNPEEARKRGQAARLFAEKHLNWEIIANQTMSVYNKIIEN